MPSVFSLPASPRRRMRNILTGVLVVVGTLCIGTAEARCVKSGMVYSCLTPGGPPIMMTCYGTGGARTCADFAGKIIIVGQHWRMQLVDDPTSTDASMTLTPTEDVSFEQQLETALAANTAANPPKKNNTTTTGGTTLPKPTAAAR